MAFLFALAVVPVAVVYANDYHRLQNFRGEWKFRLGDNMQWADPKLNDSRWDDIYVPSTWEDEGYPGYDGYAWYRRHFNVPSNWMSKDLVVDLGTIDDVDEVYVNGELIGSMGTFPPEYSSAYDIVRSYPLSPSLLRPDGDNVIAVRVFDDHGVGGITGGSIGIFEREYVIRPDVRLPATWKFKTGDNMEWAETRFDDSGWKNVHVPAYWETQGFKDYDGYGWYRVKFKMPTGYEDESLILLVGRIDDFDETYLNGERIGRTGMTSRIKLGPPNSDDYAQLRAYMIPAGVLQPGKENVLAVRVYDSWQGGGIYDGPIGITTRKHYVKDKRWYRHVENWFDHVIENIIDQ